MAPADLTEEQRRAQAVVQRATEKLVDAIKEAADYLDVNAQSLVINALQLHATYVQQRIAAVERAVDTASRLLRQEQDEPRIVEEGHKMVRLLNVERETLIAEKEEREKIREAALNAASKSKNEQAVVVRKPPLPPMPIPRFAGNVVEYRNFMTLFDATVHTDTSITNSQKLAYLQSFVDDEPKQMIGAILISDENYDIARNTLELNYGQSTQTIALLYKRFAAVPKARNEPCSIRDTFNATESILQMLEKENVEVNNEKYLYGLFLEKWPWSLIRHIMREEELPMDRFREALAKDVKLQIKLMQSTGYVAPPPNRTQRRPFETIGCPGAGPQSSGAEGPGSGYGQQTSSGAESWRAKRKAKADQQVPLPPIGERKLECPMCGGDHYAESCTKFTTASQREKALGNKCKCCFRVKDSQHACFKKIPCRTCQSTEHNRALCPTRFPDVGASGQSRTMFTQAEPAGKFSTVWTTLRNPRTGAVLPARVLLDSASNRTIVAREVAVALGLNTASEEEPATGLGGREVEPISEQHIIIEVDTQSGQSFEVPARITARVADDVQVPDVEQFRREYPQYNMYYMPPQGIGKPVDMIIGTDRLVRFLSLERSVRVHDALQLMSTKFGWMVIDEPEKQERESQPRTFFTQGRDAVEVMQDLDVLGLQHIADSESELEERAIDKFYETLTYLDEKRYQIHWPWREYPPNLSHNFGLAVGRLRSLYRKLSATPQLLEEYSKIIAEQIEEGVVEDVPISQMKHGGVIHYIPHHAVITPEKSTAVRIVYDASAALGKAKSLNQNILKGKKWLNNVVGSLLRFRKHKWAITADIRRAFHQIAIAESERDAVRFLWVKDTSKPPEGDNIRTLRFRRIAFGIVASPFLLYATIQHHLKTHPSEYTDILCREMYADNLLVSLPQAEKLQAFYKETKAVFGSMSMDMTKWKSNNQELMAAISPVDTITEEVTFVLGITWSVQEDEFSLKQPKISKLCGNKATKRIILKITASVFDPCGWVAPLILLAKLLLRRLWKEGQSWDKQLKEEDEQSWQEIVSDIQQVHTIKHRRMYFTEEFGIAQRYEIHLFADASKHALGAVIYLRAVFNEEAEISIVMARTRLAPKAKLSTPRLELYAMTLGCRLLRFVWESLQIEEAKPAVIGWSDSKCVLAWIKSTKMLPTVVERQLKEIRPSLVQHFRYVPTTENPADMASRGASINEMQQKQWFAPQWLKNVQSWPEIIEVSEKDMEEENETLFIQTERVEPIPPPFGMEITRYSELQQLLRKTAFRIWVLNVITEKLFGRKIVPTRMNLDYEAAKWLWVRWDQRRNGSDCPRKVAEMKHLKQFEMVKDERGIVRCITRIAFDNAKTAQPTQIILVKNSHLTQLIVMGVHIRNLHVGTSQTLATVRKQYWLTHGRREVYKILRKNCLNCSKYKAKPYDSPPIPPLPQFRVTRTSQPFQNVGVDVFGPIMVQPNGQRRAEKQKRWVLLMTCMVVRAIHLEVLQGLDTMDIISAIKRFTARRGTPRIIVSDNAAQFHLVDGCIRELWGQFVQEEQSSRYFAQEEIEWRFVPQHAPWMGGVYERLIGLVKTALKRTYGERVLSEREFDTTVVEIEAVVNNRPITYVDREPGTILLTPNHFLRAEFPAIPVKTGVTDGAVRTVTGKEIIKYWKISEKFLNEFWRHWSRQYLTELRNPSKNEKQKRKPRVNDVVLMADPTQRRGYWRTAVIERLLPSSSDKQSRSAQVRLASGTRLIRPITKLAPLELLNEVCTDDEPVEEAVRFAQSVRLEGADWESAETPDKANDEIVDIEIDFGNSPEND